MNITISLSATDIKAISLAANETNPGCVFTMPYLDARKLYLKAQKAQRKFTNTNGKYTHELGEILQVALVKMARQLPSFYEASIGN